MDIADVFIAAIVNAFEANKRLADRAIEQVPDEKLRVALRGWTCLLTALKALKTEDCGNTVLIRGEPHSVPLALERSLGHTCYHIGQIVQAARVHAGEKWNTLTIPRGGSEQFNKSNWGQFGRSHS